MRKGGEIIGYQGSSKDITNRKQAEEQIKAKSSFPGEPDSAITASHLCDGFQRVQCDGE